VSLAAAAEPQGVSLLLIVATILGFGVLSQVLSAQFRVPSVVFLIAVGIVLGPEGFGLLGPEVFGGALSAIVGVSVAIIVFEGAFHLKFDKIREAPSAAFKMVTVGAVIALVGTAVTVRYALGATWPVSFLIGALLVATGPTVITPILEVVPVRNRVAAVLEREGIVNDVSAAIIAVVVFEVILTGETAPLPVARLFVERLGGGMLVGAAFAAVLYYVLSRVDLSPGNAPQNARLLVLAGAVVAFGVADFIFSEAGVAAVATAGIILGNLDVPYEEDIESFKGDVTLVVLSFVFIALASLLRLEFLLALGLGGVLVVAAVALVLRPLLVFLSTTDDRLTNGEKLFVSFVGPRGIIPASVATLFAVELTDRIAKHPQEPFVGLERGLVTTNSPNLIVGTVFLVILTTVVLEGGFARQIASALDIIPMRIIIVGGGKVGRSLAERLESRGENVVLIEKHEDVAERARDDGFTVYIGDGTDTDLLRSAGAENAKVVVAATGNDDANLLVSQLVSSKFDPESVIARANDPGNVDAFEELGVRTVSSTLATAMEIDNVIERPSLSEWMNEIGKTGDVQEVSVTTGEHVGMTVAEFGQQLPPSVLIALVGRDGENWVPNADFTIQEGDRLTFLGNREAVREAMNMVNPDHGER